MTFPILGANSAVGGYAIDNSLRFNDDDSAYLIRTPASAGNRKTYTVSFWVKRANLGLNFAYIFDCDNGASQSENAITFDDDRLRFSAWNGSSDDFFLETTQLFRDTSAWYHIIQAVDTTQATASNRVKFYVNGNQVTDLDGTTYPSLNYDMGINSASPHAIGRWQDSAGRYFDGYLAEFNFIDGQALSPTDFGEFDEDSGIWKPISYSGSYGTNGFYLDFENSGSLGADQSGNGNNFTPTNLASTDQTTDTPTNNFATLNALQRSSTNAVLSEGNCKLTNNTTSNPWQSSYSTIGMNTGKWYWEYKVDSQNGSVDPAYGIVADSNTQYQDNTYGNLLGQQDATSSSYGISFYGGDGTVYWSHIGGFSNSSAFGGHSVNDIIGVAVDFDNDAIYFSVNGTYVNSGDPTSGASKTGAVTTGFANNQTWFAQGQCYTTSDSISANFGNPSFAISSGNSDGNGYGNFEYAPPSGYLALCTQNLATELSPTIDDGSEYFNTVLYSGNGVDDRSITGVGFQPDFVWGKNRSSAGRHTLADSTRGATQNLWSERTDAEGTELNVLQAFESDGFEVGSDTRLNASGNNFVAWNWKANAGSTSSNTDGSITSTVQANTTAGFSIVTWTGTGANATVGHGLGVAPSMIISKNRDLGTGDWVVYHSGIGATKYLQLNQTAATGTSAIAWNNTEPTSSVFSVGTWDSGNGSGDNIVSYCFADIEGYSKFGSYIGNGNGTNTSADGTFVYTAFKPSWVMVKASTVAQSWTIFDNKRDNYNVADKFLYANTSDAETTGYDAMDFLSNGFKLRKNLNGTNDSDQTFIYMAFAENPFVSSTGIPVTAR